MKKLNAKKIFLIELGIISAIFLGYLFITLWDISLFSLNDDNYFQLVQGQYILDKGSFPITEPFRMHENFHYMIPQWLFSVLIVTLKNTFGNQGLLLYTIPCMLLIGFLMVRIVDENFHKTAMSKIYVVVCLLIYAFFYSFIRPYTFTTLMIVLSVYLLERWKRTGKKWLYVLPIISVLMINFHNSLWISLLLVFGCYMVEEVVLCFLLWKNNTKDTSCRNRLLHLIIACVLCIASACINPYGIDYLLYIFPSLEALKPLNPFIGELKPLYDSFMWLFIIVITMALISILIAFRSKKIQPIRYYFLTFGFSFMFIMNNRNGLFFLTVGQMLYFSLLDSQTRFIGNISEKRICNIFLICFSIFLICCSFIFPVKEIKPFGRYEAVEQLTLLVEPDDAGPVFTTFNTGSYALYKGYEVYIDTCAEIYGEAVNQKFDVAQEYVDTFSNYDVDKVKKFMEKYDFKYAVVDTKPMAKAIEATGLYDMVYIQEDAGKQSGGWLYVQKERN